MKILFLCTHNACRSITAEVIAQEHLGSNHQVRSAGSAPRGVVHPSALQYLQETNRKINGLQSQSWDEFADFQPDYIITLCDSAAQEACPIWFGESNVLHWPFSDPSKLEDQQEQRQAFQTIEKLLIEKLNYLQLL